MARLVVTWSGLVVVLWVAGCASRAVREYPQLAKYAGRRVASVDFPGSAPFDADTLQRIVRTEPTRCSLLGIPICIPFTSIGRRVFELDPGVVAGDVDRLTVFYRGAGYFGTRVRPDVELLKDGDVAVSFNIDRTAPVVLDTLIITGLDGVLDTDSLRSRVPLRSGEIFNLGEFAATADTMLNAMRRRGHARAEVLRNFSVNRNANTAIAKLEAVPGPEVMVDSIVIIGAGNLGRTTVLRQLGLAPGDPLIADRLVQAQRNLYDLDIVQFATVSIAADSLQAAPQDSTTATVAVRIAEASVHEVNAAVGFGTVECFRGSVSWVSRSFLGGARTLALGSSVDKVGIGAGLGGSVCSAYRGDTLATSLDYRFGATLTQPYFVSARNSITLDLYAERQSEPSVFQFTSQGGAVAFTRRLRARSLLSAGIDIDHGSTVASPALFCGAFDVCDPQTIDVLSQPRFSNTMNVSWFHDRTDNLLDPMKGFQLRSAMAWAPSWLGSDVTFTRWTGEVASYHTLQPGWVGAVALRLGTFFQSASPNDPNDFLPPEDRFFAGGPNTVRGFKPNRLGPGVYLATVQDSLGEPLLDEETGQFVPDLSTASFEPSGGSSLVIANLELRFPSPFLSHLIRLATFVDVGAVGVGQLTNIGGFKATPGFGIRVATPVGAIRVDLAYNPYPPPAGPLYVADPDGGIERVLESFRPPTGDFFSRLRLYLAVGQAF